MKFYSSSRKVRDMDTATRDRLVSDARRVINQMNTEAITHHLETCAADPGRYDVIDRTALMMGAASRLRAVQAAYRETSGKYQPVIPTAAIGQYWITVGICDDGTFGYCIQTHDASGGCSSEHESADSWQSPEMALGAGCLFVATLVAQEV